MPMMDEMAGDGGAPPAAETQDADPGAMPHDEVAEGQMGIIHIGSDMLPDGMSKKVKKGDILEFKAIGPADAEGDIPVTYNTGDDEEKKEPWEDSFRKEMSPRGDKADTGGSGGSDNPGSGY